MTNKTENNQPEQEIEISEDLQQENEQIEESIEIQDEPNLGIDELAIAQARIAELETYIAEANNRERDILLRAKAENENTRRRAEQDVEKAHKFALEKFSKDLLNVVDNLERALETLEGVDETIKPLIEGVELTHKELTSVLNRYGVQAFGEVGEAFNPEMHQAISQKEAEGIETNHISIVLQKGYKLNERVIRDAMVMVAP
ncbi:MULTISPECIES: nucleotide exchange factor GrpE [Pasteurellaceae]|uniref:Protein GrpE n=1 Tax=Pasteurella atlantica TaxID=2827233 RepID=A0AAW8CLW8_9PAST|nr:nucleotide exchange factor GrpE [Pasteurella atlantica]MBR0573757.1 nucleotide exchange factor GrpE [Pasteurella atlantica]MDP8039693.1 nucleotide exchange factor GrpE [Pasteurella atlantica]MDP8041878.1 nucleotide exchange factor GrpE [Pasteurella atlantica]MDP8044097.1 nucleotide exchange factor GrpE [Pasteurella atlantica]MDP8046075.1 nucleotide exchange factor GrpE [Pasteurella atlantica]